MALPMYGFFMRKVYNDKSLEIDPKAKFPPFTGEPTIEVNCGKYQYMQENEYDELMEGYN